MHLVNPNDMVMMKSSEGGKHSKKEKRIVRGVPHQLDRHYLYYYTQNNQTMIKLYFCFYYISINIPKSKQPSIQIWKGNKKKN